MKPDGNGSSALLLGASGFLGPALLDAFGGACAVKTHCKHPVKGSLFFDTRSTRVSDVLAAVPGKPAAAIILPGITDIDSCARDPAGFAEVNVRGIIRVIGQYFTRAAVQSYFAARDGGK